MQVYRFVQELEKMGLTATIRATRGLEAAAAVSVWSIVHGRGECGVHCSWPLIMAVVHGRCSGPLLMAAVSVWSIIHGRCSGPLFMAAVSVWSVVRGH